ncbi:MAG: 30S ribosomal protein S6 [Anaerolineaceae bacterium]|nr:30S ribosomal protein S6 [Anaerolineaceae bacterium]
MRTYEIIMIFQPDLEESVVNEVLEKVNGWITAAGGTVDKTDMWGKKRMAYEIQKVRDGNYVMITSTMPPTATNELTNNFRFVEPVMRSMISVIE